jgi:hypothetical protein
MDGKIRTLLLAIVAVAALAFSGAASALDDDPPDEPPPTTTIAKPNLVIGVGTVTSVGSEWELSYTVTNRGNAATSFFRVDVAQNGSALLKSTLHGKLDPGASRSETFRIPRADCYIPVRFYADSTRIVAESSEADNTRWAIGLVDETCATQPRYQVKAVSFHAVDETGTDWLGSDEPYWIFNGVGVDGTAHSTESHVFGDIDSGDTASLGSVEGCIYLNCSGGAAPRGIGISIQLWERDWDWTPQTLIDHAKMFSELGGILDEYVGQENWLSKASFGIADGLNYIASWTADDLIGSQTYVYHPVSLAQRLPAIGASFNDTRTYSGGGGTYTMTTTVMRVG